MATGLPLNEEEEGLAAALLTRSAGVEEVGAVATAMRAVLRFDSAVELPARFCEALGVQHVLVSLS